MGAKKRKLRDGSEPDHEGDSGVVTARIIGSDGGIEQTRLSPGMMLYTMMLIFVASVCAVNLASLIAKIARICIRGDDGIQVDFPFEIRRRDPLWSLT